MRRREGGSPLGDKDTGSLVALVLASPTSHLPQPGEPHEEQIPFFQGDGEHGCMGAVSGCPRRQRPPLAQMSLKIPRLSPVVASARPKVHFWARGKGGDLALAPAAGWAQREDKKLVLVPVPPSLLMSWESG